MNSHKYTGKELFILIMSTLCFLGCVFQIVTGSQIGILVFFVLHSVLLLLFFYLQSIPLAVKEEPLEAVPEEPHVKQKEKLDRIAMQMEKQNETILGLRVEIETLKQEKKELEQALQVSQSYTAETPEINPEESDGILPPLTPGENTYAPINIIDTAHSTIEEMTPFAEKASIQIMVSSNADQIMVKACDQRIRILFRNIIDNSIKYMNRSGRLIITISNIGSDIFIVCKDNGTGLSSEETDHIFELNYQGSNRISGNGLGLAQAKSIANAYGGTIYAKSQIGKGMGIYIQLPTD